MPDIGKSGVGGLQQGRGVGLAVHGNRVRVGRIQEPILRLRPADGRSQRQRLTDAAVLKVTAAPHGESLVLRLDGLGL